jgi:hypothetical protein
MFTESHYTNEREESLLYTKYYQNYLQNHVK